MKTVIMAGGRGTRISPVSLGLPKPLIRIEGVPVLEHEIICLREQGFNEIIITVSYMADQIINYFCDGSKFGVKIEYYFEEHPLGNAGALFKIRHELGDDPFLLLNADSLFNIDFNRFVDYHRMKNGLVTIFTHPNSHPYDSGLILSSSSGEVMQWLTKEEKRPVWYQNRVNAGLHVIDPVALDITGINPELIGTEVDGKIVKVDLDRQVLKPLCGTGKMFCYDSPEYVKDMGTPDRYLAVCEDFRCGRVREKNLKLKQKAVFLDRDGTINRYIGFLTDIDEFELLPGVGEAIRSLNSSGYLVIVITNQPVIARGEVTYEQLQMIHNKMETLLGAEGAYLDGIYFCPHHPHKGFDGEIPELKIDCDCRKPKPGMLLHAAKDFNIDLQSSWMIGDGVNDINAGKAAGCKTGLIGVGQYGQDVSVTSLQDFVNYLFRMQP